MYEKRLPEEYFCEITLKLGKCLLGDFQRFPYSRVEKTCPTAVMFFLMNQQGLKEFD